MNQLTEYIRHLECMVSISSVYLSRRKESRSNCDGDDGSCDAALAQYKDDH